MCCVNPFQRWEENLLGSTLLKDQYDIWSTFKSLWAAINKLPKNLRAKSFEDTYRMWSRSQKDPLWIFFSWKSAFLLVLGNLPASMNCLGNIENDLSIQHLLGANGTISVQSLENGEAPSSLSVTACLRCQRRILNLKSLRASLWSSRGLFKYVILLPFQRFSYRCGVFLRWVYAF